MASTLRALTVLVEYELLRSLARRRVLLLLTATLLLEVAIYFVLTRLPPLFVNPIRQYAWSVGLIAPSTALLHVLAITIGASASSEEYETGTADFWFTRPISRLEYFAGKTLGGLLLLGSIIALYSSLALVLSWYAFGPQSRLDALVLGIAASLASAAPSFALGVALGELTRRSMIAILLGGILFFGSVLFQSYANVVAVLNNDTSLLEIASYLPSWGAVGYTVTVVSELLNLRGFAASFFAAASGLTLVDVGRAHLSILAYSVAPFLAAWFRLRYGDVTRRSA